MEFIRPYDDDTMVYDWDEHRYILTPKCVLDELNTNLSEALNPTGSASRQRNPEMVLDQISTIVYSQIYLYGKYPELQEMLLARTQSARKIIKDAMKQQVLYFLFGGDISVYSGVDFKKGKKVESFEDRILSYNSRAILMKPLRETGRSILYTGDYPRELVYGDFGYGTAY